MRWSRTLAEAGIRQLFTLSGNHVMPVFDAAVGTPIALIHTRHEAAAVHMADAWARLTGEVGIALVTGGPGHANAVSALYTAQMASRRWCCFGPCAARAAGPRRLPGDAAGRHGRAGAQGVVDLRRAPPRWPPTWRARCASPAPAGPGRCT